MGRPLSQEDIDITVESFEDFVKAYRKDNRVIFTSNWYYSWISSLILF